MDLERELRALRIAWPAAPAFQGVPARRRRRWPFVAAIALAALAAAFAVPQSRGAILRFFDIGADRIEFSGGRLPRARQRPLGVQLGARTSLREARSVVPQLLLPPLRPSPPLYRSGEVVSLVFSDRDRPVLLSEVAGDGAFLKKLAGGATSVQSVTVRDGRFGLWLAGKPHVFFFPHEPPRLAGNTLVWQENDTTYRLEARRLTRQEALDLARALRDTP
jgi:hypothetical protein